MKTETIQIVDRGRGLQLSSSRITVQDVLPYYRDGASNEEIRRWIPSLTDDEIAVLKDYIRDHYEEVLDTEKKINEYHDRMRAGQPAWTRANDHLPIEERKKLLREKLAQRNTPCVGDMAVPVTDKDFWLEKLAKMTQAIYQKEGWKLGKE